MASDTRRTICRPTALGWKASSLLIALEIAFLATSYSNLFFLVIVFSVALGALGYCWTRRNLAGLAVDIESLPAAPAGAGRDIGLRVGTGGRRRFDLAVALDLGAASIEIAYLPIAADGALIGRLPGVPRGVVAVRRLRVESQFPFGLFAAARTLPLDLELVTYPDPDGDFGGRGRSRRPDSQPAAAIGRAAMVMGLRPYRAGDPPRDVHWKATARRGSIVVKEREAEATPHREFVLDRRSTPEELEGALAVITRHVLDARTGPGVRLVSQDTDWQVDRDGGGLSETLRWLAAAAVLPAAAAAPPALPGARLLPERRHAEAADA